MAIPTFVNSQITDAVTQSNVSVVAESPAIGSGNLLVATSQALGNAAHGATAGLIEAGVASRAAMTQSVASLLTLGTSVSGKAAQQNLAVPA